MNLSELEQLVALVKDAHISELTLRQGEARLTIRKPRIEGTIGTALVPYEAEDWPESDSDVFVEQEPAVPENLLITAPLVGIYHHVKPLVGLGAKVTAGQTVGVIEAMRLVNEVTSPCAGVVTDVFAEDGLPVEYGQSLFEIQPE